jgi:hypothetical protein
VKRFLAILIISLISIGRLFAQPDTGRVVILALGMHQTFISNPAFNSWTMANYGRTIHSSSNISGQASFALKKYDGGLYATGKYPFQNIDAYFGPRLTSYKNKFSSFLNLEFGELDAHYKNISPINYTPTPDQQGKDLELHYDSYYVGISSLNYFKVPFTHNRHLALYPGFHLAARYGFGGGWSYGYYKDDGINGFNFKSVSIHDIPNLGKFNVDAGLFIGFGTR